MPSSSFSGPAAIRSGSRRRASRRPPAWDTLNSPETYLGSARAERWSEARAGELPLNRWALEGLGGGEEAAELEAAGGSLAYRFERATSTSCSPRRPTAPRCASPSASTAGRPGTRTASTPPRRARASWTAPRMYQLIRRPGAVAPATFEITFRDAGVRAYVFTFG